MKKLEHVEQANWLAHKLTRDGRLNLLCFPYAGGTSALFNRWRQTLPNWINVCPLVFPGRESRHREMCKSHFPALADDIAEALLLQLHDVNFALYGHSMGAWFAHDLALRACRQNSPPRGLLVSGQRAPQFAYPFSANHEISDADLLRFIKSFGGLDAELLTNENWVEWMLRLMRADLSLCETHKPAASNTVLSCPLHLFANNADPLITLDSQLPWQFRTSGPFSFSLHSGGHFFIRTHDVDFLGKLVYVLDKISQPYKSEE